MNMSARPAAADGDQFGMLADQQRDPTIAATAGLKHQAVLQCQTGVEVDQAQQVGLDGGRMSRIVNAAIHGDTLEAPDDNE
jgi:hypothetical protein